MFFGIGIGLRSVNMNDTSGGPQPPANLGNLVYYKRDGITPFPAINYDLSDLDAITVVFDLDYLGDDTFTGLAYEYSGNSTNHDGFYFAPRSAWGTSGKASIRDRAYNGVDIDADNHAEFDYPTVAGVHRYMIVYDRSVTGSDEFTVYIDGVQVTVTGVTDHTADITTNFTADTLNVANRPENTGDNLELDGGITTPVILDHAATQADIDFYFGTE